MIQLSVQWSKAASLAITRNRNKFAEAEWLRVAVDTVAARKGRLAVGLISVAALAVSAPQKVSEFTPGGVVPRL
jgi:hypothetical protein